MPTKHTTKGPNHHPFKRMRLQHDLTQQELAVLLGTSANYIAQVESYYSVKISHRVMVAFCDYFKVDPFLVDEEISVAMTDYKKQIIKRIAANAKR